MHARAHMRAHAQTHTPLTALTAAAKGKPLFPLTNYKPLPLALEFQLTTTESSPTNTFPSTRNKMKVILSMYICARRATEDKGKG